MINLGTQLSGPHNYSFWDFQDNEIDCLLKLKDLIIDRDRDRKIVLRSANLCYQVQHVGLN